MRRVVASWLPMEDVANEAIRIVRGGMAGIIEQFDDEILEEWHAKSPSVAWGDYYMPVPEVDVVVGKHVTFVSAKVDAECQYMERMIAEMQARFRVDMQMINEFGAFRRRHILGLSSGV